MRTGTLPGYDPSEANELPLILYDGLDLGTAEELKNICTRRT
jgi:hypothetical protein